MHILFLTDNFPPEVNAPASRTFEHTREWVKAGNRVTVITCAPNFPKGKVYPGYKNKLWQSEKIEGITVLRVWTYITANEGFIKRTLDYQSFMLSGVMASLFVRDVDVVIGTSPQFFTACAAYLSGLLKRVPFVFELRDIWPESIKAVGAMRDSFIIRFLERIEMFLYSRAALIVSVTGSFRDKLVERGVDGGKIVVVTNGVDITRFKPVSKNIKLVEELGLKDSFVAGYIGTHGLAHALETLLDVAEDIQNNHSGKNFKFIFLGDGARKQTLKDNAEKRGIKNVLFIDSVSKEQVPEYWSLLDVAIVHLKKNDLFKTVIPSKIFECMGMGIPILHGVAGESADIIRKENVGICFEPENAVALRDAIFLLQRDSAQYNSFREACFSSAPKYDRRKLALQMLGAVSKLVHGSAKS